MNRKNRKGKPIWEPFLNGESLSCESVNLNSPDGIDLRDRFAIEMMKVYLQKEVRSRMTLINRIRRLFNKKFITTTTFPQFDKMARTFYQFADAMMEERNRKNNQEQ